MISSENRSPLCANAVLRVGSCPGGAGLTIKVDASERLLSLVGNYAAGKSARDHKCVLKCAWRFLAAPQRCAKNINLPEAPGFPGVMPVRTRLDMKVRNSRTFFVEEISFAESTCVRSCQRKCFMTLWLFTSADYLHVHPSVRSLETANETP